MNELYKVFKTAAERFMRYAKIDTQADPISTSVPSSMKQLNLSKLLVEELIEAGISDVELDKYGYVYACIPSNSSKKVPTICFCAHVDTAPDCSGTNVRPILHENYQLQNLILPDDQNIIISANEFSELLHKRGENIITAGGLTLLGADDKAGVTAIMEAAIFLKNNPDYIHGDVKLLFTPDEEIGRGVDHVDIEKLNAEFAYTLDGGALGSLEDETFSADAVHITINGVSTHPGYAKSKMENALKIASEIIAQLPKENLSPETTSDREGFIHPVKIIGELENAQLQFIIRDFETNRLSDYENQLETIIKKVISSYPNSTYEFKITEQYRNMKEVLIHHPNGVKYAEQAIEESQLKIIRGSIRGGTDGSRLSYMGLPCPNLFAGEHGIHSKKEWVSEQDIQRASEVIVRICQLWEKNA